jgi:hypothetical protein
MPTKRCQPPPHHHQTTIASRRLIVIIRTPTYPLQQVCGNEASESSVSKHVNLESQNKRGRWRTVDDSCSHDLPAGPKVDLDKLALWWLWWRIARRPRKAYVRCCISGWTCRVAQRTKRELLSFRTVLALPKASSTGLKAPKCVNRAQPCKVPHTHAAPGLQDHLFDLRVPVGSGSQVL